MKILYYSPHPSLNLTDPAGYGTHMREMIQAFQLQGHEVAPLIMGGTTPRINNDPPKNSLFKRVAKAIIPNRKWQTMKDQRLMDFDEEAFVALRDKIKEFKPDFIYERANYMQVSGVRAARKAGVMHVMEMNSPYVEEKLQLEGKGSKLLGIAKQREHEQLEKSAHIAVVSSALRDYFIQEQGIFRAKFSVVPNAIDPAKTVADPALVESLRQTYHLEGKTVLGWVGSIQPWHGIDRLIQLFADLHSRRPDTALLIVGSGETVEQMKALAAKTNAGKNIHFTGYVAHKDVFGHIAAMDICLLPNTNWYCSPIKIFEYGAMGKAIIATGHPAVLDVMQPSVDGLIVPQDDASALLAAMEDLVQDPNLRNAVATSFKAKVFANHTWAANATRITNLHVASHSRIARN